MKKLLLALSLILTFFITLVGLGSTVSAKKKDGDKRTTSINFEDELIQGEVKKPELLYLLQQKSFNYSKLIKLRKNFLPEMRRTAEDLQ